MIELHHLRCFIAAADERHLGRAARRLNIPQSALTDEIRTLEQGVGAVLLARSGRDVALTAAGEALIIGARRTLAEFERAIEAAQHASGEGDVLRVGATPYAARMLVPSLVRRFRGDHPGVRVEVSEDSTLSQVAGLQEHVLDVALVTGPADVEGSGTGLRVEPVQREQFHVALPARHPLCAKRQVSIRALADEPVVLFPRIIAPRFHDLIIAACRGAGFTPRVVREAMGYEAIVQVVAAGDGVGFVPATFARQTFDGVQFRAISGMTATADVTLLYRDDDTSAALRAFVDACRTMAGAPAISLMRAG